MAKRYYWLKLQKDFFKRHDIRIIEDMPNGKDYILFYMKLLVESISHEGNLRFNETIPYNESMLSTITNTNIDIVRTAIKIFSELNLMEVMEDGTLYMNEVQTMMGIETEWAEKKRLYRDNKKEDLGQKKTLSDKSKIKSKSLEIDKELNKDIKESKLSFFDYDLVKLTQKEYDKCIEIYGEQQTIKALDKLNSFIGSSGKKYKSHYHTLNTWVWDSVKANKLADIKQQEKDLEVIF